MRLFLPFLFNVFNQFLAFRSAAFIESRINGIFIRIYKLAYKHSQQQSLTVTFCNTKTAQQFRSYFARFLISYTNEICIFVRQAVEIGKLTVPILDFIIAVTVAIPCITSPNLIPCPITVQLLLTLSVRQFVGSIRIFPI